MAQHLTPRSEFPEDLEAGILELKEERNAVILAHYYQESEVQDLADFVGDLPGAGPGGHEGRSRT